MAMVIKYWHFTILLTLFPLVLLCGEKKAPLGALLFIDGKHIAKPFVFKVQENRLLLNGVCVATVLGVKDRKHAVPDRVPDIPKELLKAGASFDSDAVVSHIVKLRSYFFSRGDSTIVAKTKFIEHVEKIPFVVRAISKSPSCSSVVVYDKDHPKPHDGRGGVIVNAEVPGGQRTGEDVARELAMARDNLIRDLKPKQLLFLPKDWTSGTRLVIPSSILLKVGDELIRVLGSNAKPDVKIEFLTKLPSFSNINHRRWSSNEPKKKERVIRAYSHVINQLKLPSNFEELLNELRKPESKEKDEGALLRKRVYERLIKKLKKTPHTSHGGLKLVIFLQGKDLFPNISLESSGPMCIPSQIRNLV